MTPETNIGSKGIRKRRKIQQWTQLEHSETVKEGRLWC